MNTEDKKNKRMKQNYISELWENVKWPNVNVIGFCKEKERDEGTKMFEEKNEQIIEYLPRYATI